MAEITIENTGQNDEFWAEFNDGRCPKQPNSADQDAASRDWLPPGNILGRCQLRAGHAGDHPFMAESTDPAEREASGLPPLPETVD